MWQSAQAASMRVYPKEKLCKVSIANDKNWQLKYSDTYKRNWIWQPLLAKFTDVQKEGKREVKLEKPWNALEIGAPAKQYRLRYGARLARKCGMICTPKK